MPGPISYISLSPKTINNYLVEPQQHTNSTAKHSTTQQSNGITANTFYRHPEASLLHLRVLFIMFNTWKYDPETDEMHQLHIAHDPITARSSQHQACDRCHEKKLKCSGERDGCERCLTAGKRCQYTREGSSSRRNRRGTSKRSEEQSQSRSSRSRREGQSSRHRSTGGGSSRAAYDDHEGTLDRFDVSMLGPDDGFDLTSLSDYQTTSGAGAYSTHAYHQQTQHYQQPAPAQAYTTWPGYPASTSGSAAGYSSTTGQEYQDEGYIDYQLQYGSDPRYWPHGRLLPVSEATQPKIFGSTAVNPPRGSIVAALSNAQAHPVMTSPQAGAQPRMKSLLEHLEDWGFTALHARPMQPLPLFLFTPPLLFASYLNLSGFTTGSAGLTAAWSGLYALLALRRRQPVSLRRRFFSVRGVVRGAAVGLGAANFAASGWVYAKGDFRRDEEARVERNRWATKEDED
ncbi:hypothetical protein HJFPF1_00362 [Paramyrothecium foliicola]|nr:hypothetical protein HJFPF1_00362 [Paramyrothecium foliicola]